MSNKAISLVLGSGGARGLAHVGVIRWLEENGHEIRSISGCSIGSLIGGAYATGKLDAVVEWMESFTKKEIYSMLDLSFTWNSLVKGDKMMAAIQSKIGTDLIEDLPIKFTAVATDIAAEKEHWFQSGPIDQAIRASVSLPLFFTPYNVGGVQLIDGGILNPTPIEPTLGDDTDLTIAVDLGGPIMKEEALEPRGNKKPLAAENGRLLGLHEVFRKQAKSPVGYVLHCRSIIQHDAECYCAHKNGRQSAGPFNLYTPQQVWHLGV